jgi:tetratricopeptide (TPR) repeat protein
MEQIERTLTAFAALRSVDALRRFLERHDELLTAEAEERLRQMAFNELNGGRSLDAVSTYLRYLVLARSRSSGIAAGFAAMFGSLDPTIPPELDAIRVVVEQLLAHTDQPEEALHIAIALTANDAALRHPAWPGTPIEFRADFLQYAAYSNYRAYLIGWPIGQLLQAINLAETALGMEPIPAVNRSELLNFAGTCWITSYDATQDVAHLERGIELLDKASAVDGTPTTLRTAAELNLAGALRQRYNALGATVDLDRAITVYRRLKTPDPVSGMTVAICNNLANLLRDRFDKTHQLPDLDEAIDLYAEALAVEDQTVDRAGSRLSLIDALRQRELLIGGEADLDRAVEVLEEGIRLGSPDSGRIDLMRIELGEVQTDRYHRRGDPALLDTAIAVLTSYVDGGGKIGRARAFSALGDALIFRYFANRNLADLVTALGRHRSAADEHLRRRPDADVGATA